MIIYGGVIIRRQWHDVILKWSLSVVDQLETSVIEHASFADINGLKHTKYFQSHE